MSDSVDAPPGAPRRLRLPAAIERLLTIARREPHTPSATPATDDEAPTDASPVATDDAGPPRTSALARWTTRIRARRANRAADTTSDAHPRPRPPLRIVLAGLVIVLAAAWITTQTSLVPSLESLRAPTPAERPQPAPGTAALPAAGVISSLPGVRLAPLTLQSGPNNHYVKLTDAHGRDVLTVFVPAGQRIDVKAPLGTFTMSWASGHSWHDETRFFGPETRFQRSTEPFEFIQTDSDYMGYDVDLSQREAGNLPIHRIDHTSF